MPETGNEEMACAYADEVSAHVRETQADKAALAGLAQSALEHFSAGGSLGDFARGLGLGRDSDFAYIDSIPQQTQDGIRSAILDYLGRVPPWTILIEHESDTNFAVRTADDDATRTGTVILVGPHPG